MSKKNKSLEDFLSEDSTLEDMLEIVDLIISESEDKKEEDYYEFS